MSFDETDTGDDLTISVCQRYTPGVVLSLERHDSPPAGCTIFGLAEVFDTVFAPSARLALRANFTAPGDELRYSSTLVRSPFVIATSLNYLGTHSSAASSVTKVTFEIGRTAYWGLWNPPQESKKWKIPLWDPVSRVIRPVYSDRDGDELVDFIAVIDPGESHCNRILDTISWTYDRVKPQNRQLSIVAAYLADSSVECLDLWACSCLLLALCEVSGRISAVNCSFDLGLVCGRRGGLPSPLANYVYSFPIFEAILDGFFESRRLRGHDQPLIVAAAGNNNDIHITRRWFKDRPEMVKRHRLWRIAYPALLPEIVAVTDVNRSSDSALPADWADLPSIFPLKPCFAEEPNNDPGRPEKEGTSYACAMFAARCASWDHQWRGQRLTRFEKISKLMATGSPLRLQPELDGRQVWIDPVVTIIESGENTQIGSAPPPALFCKLFQVLNQPLGVNQPPTREFMLTGSGAFIAEWLRVMLLPNGTTDDLILPLSDLVHDLDFVYTGQPLTRNEQDQAIERIQHWALTSSEKWRDSSISVQLHSLRIWTSGIHMLQCVVPASSTFLTGRGPINPWSMKNELIADQLSLFSPPEEVWEFNPQFRNGSSGLAHAVMIWLNLTLIAARLRTLFLPRVPPSFSRRVMDGYRTQIETNTRIAFGYIRPWSADRLSHRILHAETLIAQLSQANVDCKPPSDLVAFIKQAYSDRLTRPTV